ncbi:hypothetical protein B0T24DRAFT_683491 [Lasiosphaeria ovina]|uniref:Uncharacterized protein n=1 Tax=Lasiosphaeria ovina TaxID=92902 RepID=A0AAE0JV58_9PEZI|nr:hypothetical protein B0T24DRAFT_683491 [Lasiosphaeria ovina]
MDIAHDVGLPAEQLNMATAIAAPFFVDRITDALRTPKAPGAFDFCRIVRETALPGIWTDRRKLQQHPASMRGFLSMASQLHLFGAEWWCIISLSRDEFKAFKARFEAEGDYRWPKYDYFPQLAKFVLRMAGTTHESVIEGFKGLVIEQLIDIRRAAKGSVTTGDEQRFKAAEKGARKQVNDQDSDYIPE